MDAMEIVTSDDQIEDNPNTEIEEMLDNATQTGMPTTDEGTSQIAFSEPSTAEDVREETSAKLQVSHHKSLHNLEVDKTSPANRGDGAIDQRASRSKDAIPSTSKVVVRKRANKPRVRDLCVLRPILPRKSKERAKQMLKVIARGIIIPRGMIVRQDKGRRRKKRIRRPTMKVLRLVKNKASKTSLRTIWARSGRRRSWSADSFSSDYECSRHCRCNSHQFS